MLAVIPGIGVVLALFGTPLLWAGYFLVLPEVRSRILRLVSFALVTLMHLGGAVWFSSRDEYFGRIFERYPSFTVFYFGVLIISVLVLGVLSVMRTHKLRVP